MTGTDSPKLVLTIQSHVAYGHVGNAAALLPLQRLGLHPVAIHTVQFSNHTGYGEFKGLVFPSEHILDVIDGLRARGVLQRCQAVLSGYLGDASTGQVIIDTVEEIRAINPQLVYMCDPVMGDVGRGIFVRPGIPEFLRKKAVQVATLITPNHFEFECLVNQSASSVTTVIEQARALLNTPDSALKTIIITSLRTPELDHDQLYTLAVRASEAYLVTTPYITLEPLPNGMGDTFSAILLGHLLNKLPLPEAVSKAVSSLYSLVSLTQSGQRDLPLIAHQNELTQPSKLFPAMAY